MKVTITELVLKTPFHFFALSWHGLQILKQLKGTNYKAFKKTGIWTKHYTMTLWENEKDLKDFAASGAHLNSMKQSKKIAKSIKTLTINADEMPSWKTAKQLLESVKAIQFN